MSPVNYFFSGPADSTGGTTVEPGTGSSGFSSRNMVYANSSGEMVNASGPTWDSTNQRLGIGTTAPVTQIDLGGSTGYKFSYGSSWRWRLPSTGNLILEGPSTISLISLTTEKISLGSAASSLRLSLPSTLNMTSGVGAAGAAAALPATPESYIKVLAPNNAGTLTTLYIPLYLSTG